MITFIASIILLILGYFIYGRIVEKSFGASDDIPTPVQTLKDGIDYVELPLWKIFMIQLLNIAGLGPIFGAVLGARYGTASYLWIVLGCIFMGAVHDYFSGMLSLRHEGKSIPEFTQKYMGSWARHLTRGITFFLLILVGAAFVNGPAGLLATLTPNVITVSGWVAIIMLYYIAATLLPIDKIIGMIYPVFGAALLIMAFGIGGYMLLGPVHLVELSADTFKNYYTNPSENILFPMMFIVISCGAISGFHSTQSPLMARCLKKESHGRPAFYGAMIAEGIIAIIWATAAINYFGGPDKLNEMMNMPNHNPAWAVNEICNSWLGKTGAVLALIGVVACPITTGDTAFRSARLLVADIFKIDQKTLLKRTLISLPLFIIGFGLSRVDFTMIWKYLGLLNQLLGVLILWVCSIYLAKKQQSHWILSIPAALLTVVVASYFIVAPISQGGLFLSTDIGYPVGVVAGVASIISFAIFAKKIKAQTNN
jgi:carbon starvation protein CstA